MKNVCTDKVNNIDENDSIIDGSDDNCVISCLQALQQVVFAAVGSNS